MVVEVLEYVDARGRIPYRDWVIKLDASVGARISSAILRLELGNFSQSKGVGAGVYEIRLDFGPGYRVYFGKNGEQLVILLGGGTKRRQQADIDAAHKLWAEYKLRKQEN
jgi:putative addiction module killer protein